MCFDFVCNVASSLIGQTLVTFMIISVIKESHAGDVDFARKGFAGASQQWQCPVFGTATFFGREVPENWPSGVLFTDRDKSVRHFKYEDKKMSFDSKNTIIEKNTKAICYEYTLK